VFVDEFVVNVGESDDDTLEMIHSIRDKKIRIIESRWNDEMNYKGYVYGQQKMIAQFNCTGDWAFYIEGDEIYHEKDLNQIKTLMRDNFRRLEHSLIARTKSSQHFFEIFRSISLSSSRWKGTYF